MHQDCTKIFVLAALLSSASGYRMVSVCVICYWIGCNVNSGLRLDNEMSVSSKSCPVDILKIWEFPSQTQRNLPFFFYFKRENRAPEAFGLRPLKTR